MNQSKELELANARKDLIAVVQRAIEALEDITTTLIAPVSIFQAGEDLKKKSADSGKSAKRQS